MLASAFRLLLKEKLFEAERQSLEDEGFVLKNPTRKAAVMIAFYRKAISGDLSAIKEMRKILCSNNKDDVSGKAVRIIDDIVNKNI